MRTSDFDYHLPPELIAQTPIEPRDSSRLLVMHRDTDLLEHRQFPDLLEYLRPGDVMVFNQSRVIPARLYGRRADTGSKVEFLLLRRNADGTWQALAKPGRRLRPGVVVNIEEPESNLRNPPNPPLRKGGLMPSPLKMLSKKCPITRPIGRTISFPPFVKGGPRGDFRRGSKSRSWPPTKTV
ncbi:MAG: S-adenosylmethionine:tRNA ribosyltransferase-isomerase [Chloroflexi bacterium]|nr:S-adenosylmethionine:tRNA ribosyltransferase-isomerase [Chloroflexota bacterium]